ncbi:MAG: ATP synthase F0 subunit B [Thermodesulfobacteriota bacterium]
MSGRRLCPSHHDSPQPGERKTGLRISVCLVFSLFLWLLWLTAAWASGGAEGEGQGANWPNFFWRSVNFLVLGGLLYWLLAKKVKAFFTGRREGIRTALAEAETAREAAEGKFREYSAKLDKASEEIEQIGEMIRSQGLSEKERIVAEARKAAEKMKEDTRIRIDQEFSQASQQLRSEAARLSVEMAETLLKKHVLSADHEAMVKDYIEKVR